MRARLLFAVAFALASSSSVACSSSSDTATTTTTTGTGGLPPGVTAVRCYDATKKSCEVKGESTAAGVDSVKASCTAGGGTPVDACPSAGLQGCCVVAGLGTCTYDPTAVATLQSACPLGGATWSTTAP